jgi:hypothetical protein
LPPAGEVVILLGPPVVGKTHLAIALGFAATEAGYRTLTSPRALELAATGTTPRPRKPVSAQTQQKRIAALAKARAASRAEAASADS